MINYNLPNKTASEKRSNCRFTEYLDYTGTKYESNIRNDMLSLEISPEDDTDEARIKNALDQLIICGQNRQIAYGY